LPGEPHPFVDNAFWRKWLDIAEAGTIKYIEDAKAKAKRRATELTAVTQPRRLRRPRRNL
jgi:hypothetical protein